MPQEVRSVCIIQVAQMGDIVCTTPMFRAVKRHYPQAKVFVVGGALNEEVVRGNPDIDGYVLWEHEVAKMVKKIRELNCDFACTTSPNFAGLAALYLAGVPCIAAPRVVGGWSPIETRPYKLLRRFVLAIPHDFMSYAPREYLRLLEPLGITTEDTRKYIYYTQEASRSALQKLGEMAGAPYAVVSPSAGNKIKRWPPERFAALADYIAERYMPVVVVGARPDKEEVAEMMSQVKSPKVKNLSEQLSVEELKALVAQASLFVSVDTGPLYIAEAAGVPTIDIVGPVSEGTQPPRGARHLVVVPPRKRPEIFIMNTRVYDAREAQRQAQATTVSEVTGAVDSLLSR